MEVVLTDLTLTMATAGFLLATTGLSIVSLPWTDDEVQRSAAAFTALGQAVGRAVSSRVVRPEPRLVEVPVTVPA